MCGRYYFSKQAEKETETSWNLAPGVFDQMRGGDVTPGMSPVVLVSDSGSIGARALHWGFPREEREGRNGAGLIINARSETAAERRMFAESLRVRRCVIPAEAFYETDRERSRVRFQLPGSPVLYLGGIFRRFGETDSFVILTREANGSMKPFHDRMPLILTRAEAQRWLENSRAYEALLREPMPLLQNDRTYRQLSLFDPE